MTEQARILSANPGAGYRAHKAEIDKAVARVLDSGWYILGQEVTQFEIEFASYLDLDHAIGVGSGTDALQVALLACGVRPGDEVITVSHTAVATVAAIELCGAIPVLVDVLPTTFVMDAQKLAAAITDRTKAIVPVHLYGHPADMATIMGLAAQHDVMVVEDCAQAHGARSDGRRLGTFGHVAAFSFYPTKNLASLGDGGAVATNNDDLAERVRVKRQYGWRQRYVSDVTGLNSRLDEIQAAILRVKLRYLDEENARRRHLAALYEEGLAGTDFILPVCSPGVEHVYHQYVIRCRERDASRQFLADRGIGAGIHYPMPVHQQPAYAGRLACPGGMEQTERLAGEVLSLPVYPELTDDEIARVIDGLVAWSRR